MFETDTKDKLIALMDTWMESEPHYLICVDDIREVVNSIGKPMLIEWKCERKEVEE